jgi:predicted CopG family antitoxin
MKRQDDRHTPLPFVDPHTPMKSIQVSEPTWLALCQLKFFTRSRSLDEVVTRMLQEHRKDIQSQMSLFLESARYDELKK